MAEQERTQWDRVSVTGIAAHAYHGVEECEKEEGQSFSVDISFWLDTRPAGTSDCLHHTINYAEVSQQVYSILTGPSVDLVETLAHRIALRLLGAHPLMQAVEVCVHKPQAPITVPFQDVTVTVYRTRADVPTVTPTGKPTA